jgi:hypothetical protein
MSSDCDVVVQASEDVLVSADCAQAGAEISVTVVSGGVGPAGPTGPQGPAGATGPQGPAGAAGASAWSDITGKPSTFAPSAHTHAIADTTGLQAALNGKAPTDAPQFTSNAGPATFTTDNATTTTIQGGSLGTDSVWFADTGPFSRQRSPYTNTERDKLAGIASGATANSPDATLLARANHTGTQAVGTITGLAAIATSGSASDLGTGTVPIARIPTGTTSTTVCIGNDSRLSDARTPTSHVHAAGDITSGTIATARLGSGTASASTFLRGDQAYGNASELFDFLIGSKPASATGSGGSYSWTIPATAKYITVFCHGPGAGGGSGRRGAAATARCGGGGGGCGGWGEFTYSVADLPSWTLAVTVIAGGAGGAAITTDSTDGNAGSHAAGPTKVESSGKIIAAAWGSSRGSGGGNGATAAGGDNWWSSQWSPSGGASSGRSAAAGDASAQTSNNATRGGGGGGVDAANAHYAGGAGGGAPIAFGAASGPAGGTAGGGAGPAGLSWTKVGGGGAGGGGNNSGAGGAGGNGAFPGGGGGGGGGCVNGFASGAGGNGGDGFVRITVWY